MSRNAASSAGAGTPATSANAQADNAELSTLLSASTGSSPATTKPGPLRRIRGIGGYYGSLTFRGGTLAFERGTIQSVNHDDVVVRAPDGTTMTWRLVGDTVVRDHGKASTSVLSDGQLVFVGGRAVNGARDARLIVVRTGRPAATPAGSKPATTPSAGTGANAS
jgi:hypothetical protein